MDWQPGNMSGDVEDRRGESDGGGGGGGGFNFGGGGIGIVGFLVLLVLSLVTGRNFLGSFFSGSSQPTTQTQQADPQQVGPRQGGVSQGGAGAANVSTDSAEDRSAHLVSSVLDDAQATWTKIFAAEGKQYTHAKLVLYRGSTYSGCGQARSQTGPFYCPQDQKVYMDLNFWDELRRLGGDSADFAQAYVLTHELGHHVQNLLGIEGRMQRMSQQQPGEQSALSVDLELQADCFAGVWAHSPSHIVIHPDDVADALKAAAAVGDDHIAQVQGRSVSPETFTHGSSAQREQWFQTGLQQGTIEACTTFGGRLAP